MAHYFIGDIQGCYTGLRNALAEVGFNFSKDTLWLTGDLVARGSESLQVLKFLYKHQDSVKTVLGNHDLHLLSVANGLKKENPKDKLSPLLTSKKLPVYMDWLRQQPFLRSLPKNKGYMSHAGLAPNWTIKTAKTWNHNLQSVLTSKHYPSLLKDMYGNQPSLWNEKLTEIDKLRFAINAFTRMRYCTNSGELELKTKCSPYSNNNTKSLNNLIPWFNYQPERFKNTQWLFGHWASLMGRTNTPNIIALDTGYVWGNYLSVYHLKSNSFTYIHNKA